MNKTSWDSTHLLFACDARVTGVLRDVRAALVGSEQRLLGFGHLPGIPDPDGAIRTARHILVALGYVYHLLHRVAMADVLLHQTIMHRVVDSVK